MEAFRRFAATTAKFILVIGIRLSFVSYFVVAEKSRITMGFLIADNVIVAAMSMSLSLTSFHSANYTFYGLQAVTLVGWPLYLQWLLFVANWFIGQLVPSSYTIRLHLVLASTRIILSILFVSFILYYDSYSYIHDAALSYALLFLFPSAFNFAGAYRRFDHFNKYLSQLMARRGDLDVTPGRDTSMGILSATKRMNRRKQAINNVAKSVIGPDHISYTTTIELEKERRKALDLLGTRRLLSALWGYIMSLTHQDRPELIEMGEALLATSVDPSYSKPDDPHFVPCYCCLEIDATDQISISGSTTLQYSESQKVQDREVLLSRDSTEHPLLGWFVKEAFASNLQPEKVELHALCEFCSEMCNNSRLLDLQRGPTLEGFKSFAISSIKTSALLEESFRHWPSAQSLQRSVEDGCHLCNLIWDTLNHEQQQALLEQNYQGLYLKIISPVLYRKMMSRWTSDPVDESLRLVPHFGPGRVPRR